MADSLISVELPPSEACFGLIVDRYTVFRLHAAAGSSSSCQTWTILRAGRRCQQCGTQEILVALVLSSLVYPHFLQDAANALQLFPLVSLLGILPCLTEPHQRQLPSGEGVGGSGGERVGNVWDLPRW